MESLGHGAIETWRLGVMDNGVMETWSHGDRES